ncbi:hypothetical protein CBR_g49911 [Chara braunii]|uniref:Uncharacterized protein n=1 Tax=Chara braunii TaxID=69332 RepID=A0A388JPE8_CHABU|nr:hypothetical protein CBR_g49911 [Chara braunii]|eukprot:GBG59647.1 hypothetical protein CBR_g49911 [Chara braunii]
MARRGGYGEEEEDVDEEDEEEEELRWGRRRDGRREKRKGRRRTSGRRRRHGRRGRVGHEEGKDTRKGRRQGGMEDEEVRGGGGGDKEDEEGQEEEDEQEEEEEEETKRRREEETWRMRKGRRSKKFGETDEAYQARMLLLITEAKQTSDAVAAAAKQKAEDAEKARLLAIEQQRQHDEAADWRTEAKNGKMEESGNKIALLLSHLTDLLATCITQQEDIHSLDDALAQVHSRLRQLEQRPVAAPNASSSNTSDCLEALEIDVSSLKDGVEDEVPTDQQLVSRRGARATVMKEELMQARERMRAVSRMGATRRLWESDRRRRSGGGRGGGHWGGRGRGGREGPGGRRTIAGRRMTADELVRKPRQRWDEGDFLYESSFSDCEDFFGTGAPAQDDDNDVGDRHPDVDDDDGVRGDDHGDGGDWPRPCSTRGDPLCMDWLPTNLEKSVGLRAMEASRRPIAYASRSFAAVRSGFVSHFTLCIEESMLPPRSGHGVQSDVHREVVAMQQSDTHGPNADDTVLRSPPALMEGTVVVCPGADLPEGEVSHTPAHEKSAAGHVGLACPTGSLPGTGELSAMNSALVYLPDLLTLISLGLPHVSLPNPHQPVAIERGPDAFDEFGDDAITVCPKASATPTVFRVGRPHEVDLGKAETTARHLCDSHRSIAQRNLSDSFHGAEDGGFAALGAIERAARPPRPLSHSEHQPINAAVGAVVGVPATDITDATKQPVVASSATAWRDKATLLPTVAFYTSGTTKYEARHGSALSMKTSDVQATRAAKASISRARKKASTRKALRSSPHMHSHLRRSGLVHLEDGEIAPDGDALDVGGRAAMTADGVGKEGAGDAVVEHANRRAMREQEQMDAQMLILRHKEALRTIRPRINKNEMIKAFREKQQMHLQHHLTDGGTAGHATRIYHARDGTGGISVPSAATAAAAVSAHVKGPETCTGPGSVSLWPHQPQWQRAEVFVTRKPERSQQPPQSDRQVPMQKGKASPTGESPQPHGETCAE